MGGAMNAISSAVSSIGNVVNSISGAISGITNAIKGISEGFQKFNSIGDVFKSFFSDNKEQEKSDGAAEKATKDADNLFGGFFKKVDAKVAKANEVVDEAKGTVKKVNGVIDDVQGLFKNVKKAFN